MKILFVVLLPVFFSPLYASDTLAPPKVEPARKRASSTVRFLIGTTWLDLSTTDKSEAAVNALLQALSKVIGAGGQERERLRKGLKGALETSIFAAEAYARTEIKAYNEKIKASDS